MIRNRLGPLARFLVAAAAVACWIPCVPAAAAGMPLVQTPPTAPQDLKATVSESSINLTWTRPLQDGGRAITGYQIDMIYTGLETWQPVVDNTRSTDTHYTHPSPPPSTTLLYRVAAINAAGRGDYAQTTATTPGSTGTAGAPRNLRAVAEPTTITLFWDPPISTGRTITGYQVDWSANSGGPWFLVEITSLNVYQSQHRGLSPGVTRYYQVRAVYSNVAYGPSAFAHATTVATGIPGAPRNLEAAADGSSVIDLDWDAPSSDGGSAITEYQIHESADGGNTWGFLRSTAAHVTAFTHTGLTAGTTHHYRVKARNAIGDGPWTSVVNATTADNATPGPPHALRATASGSSVIELEWRAPTDEGSAEVTGYRIEWSATGVRWGVLERNNRDTDYRDDGLSPGTTRHYRVAAVNRHGPGDWSNEASATTSRPPGRPTGLTVRARGTSSIELDWTAPSGGGPVTGYRIEWSETGTGTRGWTLLVRNSRATSYTDTALSPGTTRHYRVAAINTAGTGPWSSVAHATTEVTVPGAPTSFTATAPVVGGSDRIRLTWRAPASNGGSPITAYRIQWRSTGTSDWTFLVPGPTGTATTYLDTGLAPNTTRFYRVPRSTPKGRGTTRTRSAAPPAPHRPASPGTCARTRRDRTASPSPGTRRTAMAGSGLPATPFGAAPKMAR